MGWAGWLAIIFAAFTFVAVVLGALRRGDSTAGAVLAGFLNPFLWVATGQGLYWLYRSRQQSNEVFLPPHDPVPLIRPESLIPERPREQTIDDVAEQRLSLREGRDAPQDLWTHSAAPAPAVSAPRHATPMHVRRETAASSRWSVIVCILLLVALLSVCGMWVAQSARTSGEIARLRDRVADLEATAEPAPESDRQSSGAESRPEAEISTANYPPVLASEQIVDDRQLREQLSDQLREQHLAHAPPRMMTPESPPPGATEGEVEADLAAWTRHSEELAETKRPLFSRTVSARELAKLCGKYQEPTRGIEEFCAPIAREITERVAAGSIPLEERELVQSAYKLLYAIWRQLYEDAVETKPPQ